MYVLMGKKFTSKEERDKFLDNEMTYVINCNTNKTIVFSQT